MKVARFGVFEFDAGTLELRKNGRLLSVRPQPLTLLALLLESPGDLVSREKIQSALWPGDTFVDFEQGVNHAIRELRAALGDAADSPRFVQTLPRRGYRFIAPVEPPPAAATSSQHDVVLPTAASTAIESAGPIPAAAARRWRRLISPAAIAVAAALAATLMTMLWLRPSVVPAFNPATALRVRAFSAPTDPLLGVGLATAISARLGGQQAVSVRWTDSGEEPGITHILDGEIMTDAAAIIVLARLHDVARQQTVWSDRIVVQKDQLFSVEDAIAERVVSALRLRLVAAEQDRLRRRYTNNSEAYLEYLRGRAALANYTPESTMAAIGAFDRALERDADYALARAGLAMACADMYLRFAAANEVERWGERAEAEARAALTIDPDLAEAHLARAAVARKREFDWNATITAGRRALVLNPNLEQARFFVAAAFYHNGYMEEALSEMEKGRSLRGVDVIEPIRIEALVALFSGSFAPARAHLEEVSRLSSQAIGDTYLGLAYYYSGSVDRGRSMLESLVSHRSASTAARAGAALAGILAAQGEPSGARAYVDRVLKEEYRDHHVAYSLGAAYAQLGDFKESQRWLHTAADTGFPCVPWFERDPLLEPLRRLPEFSALLEYVRDRRETLRK
ncbi:MAG TPA: winged helix-turn-helix domain-containing protein [Vicinamibacterales bacterium]|nr:winged helix-turn-helix domain-containing protein [Vicinamibacterales bacterium]